ncbi:MAG: HAD family phosphatase [Oscillospiraceae bacterium]|nr:HAD family phosphatase [Oscillospiraceae bacterium]MDD4367533.1 HAD family phosphatase [Oscillospiraceae bacterium]
MIQNLVFDMGNVLIKYDVESYISRFAAAAEDRRILRNELFRSLEWVSMDRGQLMPEQAWSLIQPRIPVALRPAARRCLLEWHQELTLQPGMQTLLAQLKKAGCKLYVLTNASRMYHVFRQGMLPLLQYMEGEFVSADWGLLKPQPEIYQAFVQYYHLLPSETLFIDDMPLNASGAKLCGWDAVVFHGEVAGLIQDLRRHDLTPEARAGLEQLV